MGDDARLEFEDGVPFWIYEDGTRLAAIMGAAEDDDDTDDEDDDDEDEDDDDDDKKSKSKKSKKGKSVRDELEKDLPDNVKDILRKERQARADAERDREKAQRDLKKAQKDAKKSRDANATEEEKKLNAAKDEAAKEATKAAEGKIVRASIKAVAASKMANPSLAVKLLDAEDFEVDDDGDVDEDKIDAAIDKLIEENPELALGKSKEKKRSSIDSGKKGGDGKPDMNKLLRAAAGK